MQCLSEFEGHVWIAALWQDRKAAIPNVQGVYVVRAPDGFVPTFLEASRGGRFKGRDPTISVDTLTKLWVAETPILYMGKTHDTLRRRIRALLDFGSGKPIGHWGGRALWQVRGAEQFVICWRPIVDEDPRTVEKSMIAEFVRNFGKRPFANLSD
jgi:hypothetical protein